MDYSKILSGNEQSFVSGLEQFLKEKKQTFTFPELALDLRKDVWGSFFLHLEGGKRDLQCLEALRILSRDKEHMKDIICDKWVEILLKKADLLSISNEKIQKDSQTIVEALMVLCNLVFHSSMVRNTCQRCEMAENIFKRLLLIRNEKNLEELKMLDMKLLFLMTAHCTDLRIKLKQDLHAIDYLTEYLVYILNQTETEKKAKTLSDSEINLVCEILKVLFNLEVNSVSNFDSDDDIENSMRLTLILQDFLHVQVENETKKEELESHVINFLTLLPNKCLAKFVSRIKKDEKIQDNFEFRGYNMESIHILLKFLERKFAMDMTHAKQIELMPILTVLIKISRTKICRKYLKKHILPPLKDVHHRPEQGNTLRNNLCRLLTTPITQVRDLVADLLFILCKENVGRMIKYTGYGNAAGLFASRGLLGKPTLDKSGGSENPDKYSSEDSEDSDTEEYKEFKHGINPIVGCYEPPHPNPMEGMSDEQKEYEAMKLVDTMDKLMRTGVMQPCKIGEHGKPEAITHVLELQEELTKKKKDT